MDKEPKPKAHKNIRGAEYYAQAAEEAKARFEAEYKSDKKKTMIPLTKQYYSIGEVSKLLDVPIYTLWFWEKEFPMFNPNRTPKGTRRFTHEDIRMVEFIKELLYSKGLKIDAAVIVMNKTYRTQRPRNLRKCNTPQDAVALLGEVKLILEDAHALAKIDAVIKFLSDGGC